MDQTELDKVMATAYTLLREGGASEAADVVRTSKPRAEETGYDNWNGGTALWTIVLEIEPVAFARLGERRSKLEEQITARLKMILETGPGAWYSTSIVPETVYMPDWRNTGEPLPRSVRQDVIDGLKLQRVAWAGGLNEVEFLQRIFDLTALPSTDDRKPYNKNAAADIWQHRVNNEDWDDDWVYTDSRFGLLDGPSDTFLRFLCEMLHPLVREDRDEVLSLAAQINDQLRSAGWKLFEDRPLAGRPRFRPGRLSQSGDRAGKRSRHVAEALSAGNMEKEIERMEDAIDRDPALAIGTAKELVESCCKTILTQRNVSIPKAADVGDLTKLVAKELELVPDDAHAAKRGAENIKQILRSLTSMPSQLAELRGLYGTGHGRDGSHRGLQPRHARLAVGAAVTFIDFVTETHRLRPASPPTQ